MPVASSISWLLLAVVVVACIVGLVALAVRSYRNMVREEDKDVCDDACSDTDSDSECGEEHPTPPQPRARYVCNSSSKTCQLTTSAAADTKYFDSKASCDDSCQPDSTPQHPPPPPPPPKQQVKYKCSGDGKCKRDDVEGTFGTMRDCLDFCAAPPPPPQLPPPSRPPTPQQQQQQQPITTTLTTTPTTTLTTPTTTTTQGKKDDAQTPPPLVSLPPPASATENDWNPDVAVEIIQSPAKCCNGVCTTLLTSPCDPSMTPLASCDKIYLWTQDPAHQHTFVASKVPVFRCTARS